MSKSSPITNRIQKALYMRSALKQDEKKEKPIYVDSSDNDEILTGNIVEKDTPDVTNTTAETYSNTYTGTDFWHERPENKGKDYYTDETSPLVREMKKLGIDVNKDSAKDYEASKMIQNKQTGSDVFSDVTATGDDGSSRTLSGDELQSLTKDQITSRTGERTEVIPGKKEKIFEAEQVPQDFAVMSQIDAGRAGRGNLKSINK